jgi:hypothetical protein
MMMKPEAALILGMLMAKKESTKKELFSQVYTDYYKIQDETLAYLEKHNYIKIEDDIIKIVPFEKRFNTDHWYEYALKVNTLDSLTDFIKNVEDNPHDYYSSVEATSACCVALINVMSLRMGLSGHQTSFIIASMSQTLKKWYTDKGVDEKGVE